jgi:hypothetical protein
MLVEIRKRFDGIHFQVRDQSRFARIRFGDEHPLVSIGARGCRHRQDSACVTDHAIERKLTKDESVINNIMREMTCKDYDTKRDGKIVGRSLFADSGRRKIDNNAMTGEMQTGILDRGLHTLAAFLHSSIRQTDNGHTGQAVGVIHFDFDDNAFKTNDRTGENSGKHGESVDEEE